MEVPETHWTSASAGKDYRYGYNGKEKDDEIYGVGNSYDYGARIYNSRLGRWFSLDPKAHKCTSLSPYSSVGDNPIEYIDTDGKEIWIAFKTKIEDGSTSIQKVQYLNNELYDREGKECSPTNDYVIKVLNDLNQLKDDDEVLKWRLVALEYSKNIHDIQTPEKLDVGNYIEFNIFNYVFHIPTGSTTNYDPDKPTDINGNKRVPRVGLAHEIISHGYDADMGTGSLLKTENGILYDEVKAVNIENKVRAVTGDTKRTTYDGKNIPKELLYDKNLKKKGVKSKDDKPKEKSKKVADNVDNYIISM